MVFCDSPCKISEPVPPIVSSVHRYSKTIVRRTEAKAAVVCHANAIFFGVRMKTRLQGVLSSSQLAVVGGYASPSACICASPCIVMHRYEKV